MGMRSGEPCRATQPPAWGGGSRSRPMGQSPLSTGSEEMGLSGCPGPQDRDEAEVALSKLAAGDMGPGLFPPFPQAGGPGSLFTHGCLTSW